jgi:hypothetical protein
MKNYYLNGKRVIIDGVPCKVAPWINKRMLSIMREKPEVSNRLATEQVIGGWLTSDGKPWRTGE